MSQVARMAPLWSPTSASKTLNPGRRVARMPELRMRPDDERRTPGVNGGNRLKVAAVLVAERKSIQQVFERGEAGAREIGGAAGTDALQELERRGERVIAV